MFGLATISIKGEQVLGHICGFKISERKYRMIVSSQITAELEKELEEI